MKKVRENNDKDEENNDEDEENNDEDQEYNDDDQENNDIDQENNDEDEDLQRLRNGELKKDADNKMIIPTNIPKGLPKTREEEGSKRKIVSTLHSKYKDFHTQVKQ